MASYSSSGKVKRMGKVALVIGGSRGIWCRDFGRSEKNADDSVTANYAGNDEAV